MGAVVPRVIASGEGALGVVNTSLNTLTIMTMYVKVRRQWLLV